MECGDNRMKFFKFKGKKHKVEVPKLDKEKVLKPLEKLLEVEMNFFSNLPKLISSFKKLTNTLEQLGLKWKDIIHFVTELLSWYKVVKDNLDSFKPHLKAIVDGLDSLLKDALARAKTTNMKFDDDIVKKGIAFVEYLRKVFDLK